MTIEERARELGRLIGQSPEYLAVRRTGDALAADRDASALLGRMEALRSEAQRLIESGEEPTAEMELELDELLGRVQGVPVYQQLAVAQENFDKVMLRVNEWIVDGIRKGAASPIITLG